MIQTALPLRRLADLDPLMRAVGGARVVMIGEASHGNHEYQRARTQITMRLICELGFNVVAMEADAPDCAPLDRCVRLLDSSAAQDPSEVLRQLRHWPSWMLANAENARFLRKLQALNCARPRGSRVALCGLDKYPLWGALRLVLEYAREVGLDVNAALDAPLKGDPMVPAEYGGALTARLASELAPEAEGAEAHYRAMLAGGTEAMNERSACWLDVLEQLLEGQSSVVVWAHNTHIGDSRGTDMPFASIGRLARERFGNDAVRLIGLTGGSGTLMGATERGTAMEHLVVHPGIPGSLEGHLGTVAGRRDALFVFPEQRDAGWLASSLPHRAIGLVYSPGEEAYVPTQLGVRYDALCWFARVTPVYAIHQGEARRGTLETLRT